MEAVLDFIFAHPIESILIAAAIRVVFWLLKRYITTPNCPHCDAGKMRKSDSRVVGRSAPYRKKVGEHYKTFNDVDYLYTYVCDKCGGEAEKTRTKSEKLN